jgi:hypothetical protein
MRRVPHTRSIVQDEYCIYRSKPGTVCSNASRYLDVAIFDTYFVRYRHRPCDSQEPYQVSINKFLVLYFDRVRTELVEALRYKPEGCGFDSPWCHWNFSLT